MSSVLLDKIVEEINTLLHQRDLSEVNKYTKIVMYYNEPLTTDIRILSPIIVSSVLAFSLHTPIIVVAEVNEELKSFLRKIRPTTNIVFINPRKLGNMYPEYTFPIIVSAFNTKISFPEKTNIGIVYDGNHIDYSFKESRIIYNDPNEYLFIASYIGRISVILSKELLRYKKKYFPDVYMDMRNPEIRESFYDFATEALDKITYTYNVVLEKYKSLGGVDG